LKLEKELTDIPLDGSVDFQFVFTLKTKVAKMQIIFVKGNKYFEEERGKMVE